MENNLSNNNERRLWVGGICKFMTDVELEHYFSQFGNVEQAFIITDERGRSKGFAYITFVEAECASRVLQSGSLQIKDREVTVKAALPESVMNKNKIYVCRLNDDISQEQLLQYFRMFGTVVEAVIKDAGSHRFAFVRFGRFLLLVCEGNI